MMKLKKLVDEVLMLVTQPAKAWRIVARGATTGIMLRNFLYPLIALSCIINFIGKIFGSGSGGESLYPALVKVAVLCFTFICTYYIVAIVIKKLTPRYTTEETVLPKAHLFAGYSMVIVLLLDLCLGLFPNFRIIGWIAQFYTVKIVWDGAAVLMRVPEERRLGYTMIVSVMIIFVPIALGRIMSVLSVNL
ncbi:MAG: DUF1282 family protein [Bacteroidaceae bacterium]|nr:DUF1282 family protein [Bacteroidaceae bacterium]MBQ3539622.1 DUF1282 family protein [Bacteroidaceae bacterium]